MIHFVTIQQEEELQLIEKFIALIDEKIINETASNIIDEPVLSEEQQNISIDNGGDEEKSSSKKIELKTLTMDSNKLNISDLRNDLSNAIELSLKNATCMKLLMWLNTFLQINSKNQSIKSYNYDNKDNDELLLDRIPLNDNLLSFLEDLSPFETLHAPSDNFVSGTNVCSFVVWYIFFYAKQRRLYYICI